MASVTTTFNASGIDQSDFHLASTTFASNFSSNSHPYTAMQTEASSTTYAQISVDKTKSTTSYFYVTFDFSEIPNNATITATDGKIRLYSSGSYVSTRSIRFCIGDINTPLRTSQNYSTSSNPVALDVNPLQTGITVAQMKQVKCYVQYTRSSRNDNTQRYIYLYGADVTVTYDVPEPSETLYLKQNGSWTTVSKAYIKQNGVWVEQSDITGIFSTTGNYIKSN